jgi:hypothetical protein
MPTPEEIEKMFNANDLEPEYVQCMQGLQA